MTGLKKTWELPNTGPYCREYCRSTVCFSSFLSGLGPKRSMMARHKFWLLLCTLWVCNRHYETYCVANYASEYLLHTQIVYNTTQNLCLGSTKMCVWWWPDTSWWGIWAVREKRSRQYFCTVCNKDPLLL